MVWTKRPLTHYLELGYRNILEMKGNEIKKSFYQLLRYLNPKTVAEGGIALNPDAREKWINVIEKHGYSAHVYLPGIDHHNDPELWDALERLRLSGHIITDKHGLVGKVAKCRPSTQEVAEQRRAEFKIID